MANKWIYSQRVEDSFSPVQAELLEALLQPEEALYPWNPADPDTEAYFAEMENEFELEDWSDEEIMARSQKLFAGIDFCAKQVSPIADVLKKSLGERFAPRVPQTLLDAIAHKAHQVVSTNLSLADKLVECVQQLLPNWAEEDLLVLARPLAYAMRGEAETIESTPSAAWTELSDMEQARLSMAIAQYAIAHLHDS